MELRRGGRDAAVEPAEAKESGQARSHADEPPTR
jgi:hypothetical protein